MLTLYMKAMCPYSRSVVEFAEEHKIALTKKLFSESGVAEELLALGGKQQVPFLVDDELGFKLYESKLIIDHLRDHYTTGAPDSALSPISPDQPSLK
jgi:glutathione S-transferase